MKINEDYKIVIIGAGTAGLSAAVYAQRAGQDVIILDGKGYGGQIGSIDKVENGSVYLYRIVNGATDYPKLLK